MLSQDLDWLRGEDELAFASCLNRCCNSLREVYARDSFLHGNYWELDFRFFEDGVKILYERYCFAMAMVSYAFSQEYNHLYASREAALRSSSFDVLLEVCTKTAFSKVVQDFGLRRREPLQFEEPQYSRLNQGYLRSKNIAGGRLRRGADLRAAGVGDRDRIAVGCLALQTEVGDAGIT